MLVLPPELLELVLEHLDGGVLPGPDRDTVKSLTLTCSRLRPITQPILFSAVRIGETAKRDDLRVSDIRSLFQSRPESAQWIRRLYINIYNSQTTSGNMWGTDMEALAKNLETIFLNMTCLQEVDIENTHLTSAMHAHLWNLARGPLRKARLWEVEVDDILGGPPATSELAIEVFGVDFPSWKPYAPITEMIHSPRLRRLQFSTTALQSVFRICNINGHTTPTAVFSELQYLELPSPYYNADTEEFLSFLFCCPEVRTLIISPSVALPSSFSASISTTAISKLLPSLSEYAGSLELCRVLCPGRPLRAVKLPEEYRHSPFLSQADMAALAAGSVPLEAFEFSTKALEESTFFDLADFFPALKGLSITFGIVPSYAELDLELERFMHRMPRLQTLKLAGYSDSWDNVKSAAELDLITKIHAAGPSLKSVQFPGENYWECRNGLWSLSNGSFAIFDVFPSSSL